MLVLRHVRMFESRKFASLLTSLRPDGNFLIDYHPQHPGLFLATGGSGHGFKFFPVIGEKIVDAIERQLSPELKGLWRWPEHATENHMSTEDGSRAGRKGMILDEELKRPKM